MNIGPSRHAWVTHDNPDHALYFYPSRGTGEIPSRLESGIFLPGQQLTKTTFLAEGDSLWALSTERSWSVMYSSSLLLGLGKF